MISKYDAIIIGSGSNGLAAAIYLQKKGLKTAIFEQASTPGGSTRTEELTLPGFKHDIGSAIHPMAYASPFFRELPLTEYGLKWIFPDIPYSHPLKNGEAIACYNSIEKTAAQLGKDKSSYKNLFESLKTDWPRLENDI
ncbi:MAG: NAD(P)/FAD-dependent oxidoreductase, partial [Christiangramia sp.]